VLAQDRSSLAYPLDSTMRGSPYQHLAQYSATAVGREPRVRVREPRVRVRDPTALVRVLRVVGTAARGVDVAVGATAVTSGRVTLPEGRDSAGTDPTGTGAGSGTSSNVESRTGNGVC
jgi:hypothetical protein